MRGQDLPITKTLDILKRAAAEAAMARMMAAMHHAPETGAPDIDFLAMMIPHHQGAIDMARVQLEKGKDKDRVFKWKYELKGTSGTVFERYQLWGGQHRKHAKVWRGKFKVRRQEVGDLENACFTNLDDKDGFIHWEAEYTGTID